MAEGILDTEPSRTAPIKDISEALLGEFDKSHFWGQHEIDDAGCWRWTGTLNSKGYGRYCFAGKSFGAHRLAFALGKNTALPGLVFVCHRCDTPSCINPDHLFLGLASDNNKDMKAKGRARAPRNMDNPACKLTEQDIRDIRASSERQVDLCRKYGVSDGHMSRILSGYTRRYVSEMDDGNSGRTGPGLES